MNTYVKSIVLIWLIASAAAFFARRFLSPRFFLVLAFASPNRFIPLNVAAFWLILLLAVVVSLARFLRRS